MQRGRQDGLAAAVCVLASISGGNVEDFINKPPQKRQQALSHELAPHFEVQTRVLIISNQPPDFCLHVFFVGRENSLSFSLSGLHMLFTPSVSLKLSHSPSVVNDTPPGFQPGFFPFASEPFQLLLGVLVPR